jgi:hypothetical protein
VGNNVGLRKKFEADGNLSELIGLKPSKFKISDIHGLFTGEK